MKEQDKIINHLNTTVNYDQAYVLTNHKLDLISDADQGEDIRFMVMAEVLKMRRFVSDLEWMGRSKN